ncbi:MAG: hydroxyacid dehydrogenase [Clostridia bacterium]|nr:hydroxyacid dehydrogenase [Clostridia bacterium]
MKYNVLVTLPDGPTKDTFLPENVKAYLEEHFNVRYNTLGRQFTQEEFKEELKDIDFAVTGWGTPSIGGGVLDGNDRFKVFAHTGGSVGDFVDDSVYAKGVKVCSGNYYYAESVAEGTAAYIMMCLRSLPDHVQSVRNGKWREEHIPSSEGILDQEIGIISCGAISKQVMRLLQPFRCKFKVFSNYTIDPEYLASVNAKQVSLEELLSTCHIISLHSALNEKTKGSLGREQFEMMQEDAVFINTARGAIIKEDEMIEVLKARPKMRAVLDVFVSEPIALDSPLRSLPNVYCIPHMGGPTIDRRKHIGMAMAEELVRYVNGEPLKHEITKDVASRMTKERPVKK